MLLTADPSSSAPPLIFILKEIFNYILLISMGHKIFQNIGNEKTISGDHINS